MDTRVVRIDRERLSEKEQAFFDAAQIIRSGGLVAFPTETVYGLGANALEEQAARKIYKAKGRPSDNPLIVHIAKKEELNALVKEIPEPAGKLMDSFWPGPLTMILYKSDLVPYETTGGLDTVAVRMPSDPVANRLIEKAAVPVAAPSANISGRPSPTTAEHVYQDLNGRIDMILDGGPVDIGVESTILEVTGPKPVLLRPGAITMEMLTSVAGVIEVDPAILGPIKADMKPKAPGMKYRHYAPKADLILVEEPDMAVVSEVVVDTIRKLVHEKLLQGACPGILCTEETRDRYPEGIVRSLGFRAREETIAHNLFAVLREFDELSVNCIYAEGFPKDHLGQAIMNRLIKASGYHIIDVEKL